MHIGGLVACPIGCLEEEVPLQVYLLKNLYCQEEEEITLIQPHQAD
jgi:hypothetical protein